MIIALVIMSAAAMTPAPAPIVRDQAIVRADQSKNEVSQRPEAMGASGGDDISALMSIVMMESAKSEQDDLRDMMDHMKRLNQQKQEARELLAAMKREQERIGLTDDLKRGQRDWAHSLKTHCPPGALQDNCIMRQLRLRTEALQQQPTPNRR